MANKDLVTFVKKTGIFLLPILALIIGYFYSDPFKVNHTYKAYNNQPIELNQGYISWQSFLNHRDSLKYDSFILGNSCTMAYPTTIWKSFLENANPIRLNANSESLYAIYKKIKRLDESGVYIKNVLLIIDNNTLGKVVKNTSHTRILHPDISGISETEFKKEFITAFFNPKFLIPYIDYCIFHTYRKYMRGVIMEKDDHRNQLTNDIRNPRESEIEQFERQYWVTHKKEFPARELHIDDYSQVIFNTQKKMLSEICEIFKKHKTDYQIIINPEWSQRKFNNQDLIELKNIFETDRIHNFSGKNIYTENQEYFYEKSHYRPLLGRIILQEIYTE
ncbi:histidine kinase [Ancylomarina euxinus]|uniref:Histidine kinase n=1 Tax=Ancylomarina euxinus TaxID=2283627 RepID=A0A425Y841_9BACT|nr:histidine kinase [Ancylomarina euxinus]MCZ4693462.1 hypothetical protein [Ancylomarina euxinus]MUP13689.1 histidine kinase [Ancylomarina euxinus]RRG24670.1 histidine kinase [Ancylomarina euxinus]